MPGWVRAGNKQHSDQKKKQKTTPAAAAKFIFHECRIFIYINLNILIVPQPRNIKADQEFTTFHFCTIRIGIVKRAVIIIEIISLLVQQEIVTQKQLERVTTCIKLNPER